MYIYRERLLYINPTVTTNQKSIINTHTKKRNESKCNTKGSHQIVREDNERRRKKELQKQPPNN